MKTPKAIRVIYTATLIAVGVLLASTFHVPPRIETLPGRDSSAISAPTVVGGSHAGRSATRFSVLTQSVLAAHSPKISNAAANAAADAVAALMNSGYLKIYDGSQAATADTATSGQTLCATLRFSSTAFGAASAGVATANAITSDTDAAATCTASWARILKSDNSTIVMDQSVCTSGCDINLATTSIVQHATVSVSAYTYTQAKS